MEIFDYDNILLLPRKCRVESRSECDAGVELGGRDPVAVVQLFLGCLVPIGCLPVLALGLGAVLEQAAPGEQRGSEQQHQ